MEIISYNADNTVTLRPSEEEAALLASVRQPLALSLYSDCHGFGEPVPDHSACTGFGYEFHEPSPVPSDRRYSARVLGEWMDTEPCTICGQPFPGDHEQHIDNTPGEIALVSWTCPIVEGSQNAN